MPMRGSSHAPMAADMTAERWAVLAGGIALGVVGLGRRNPALAALGGGLLVAGAAGAPLSRLIPDREGRVAVRRRLPELLPDVGRLVPGHHAGPLTTQAVVTIAAPQERIFRHWRNFANLPMLFAALDRVDVLSESETRWTARGPGDEPLTWTARLDHLRENELIGWRTADDAPVPHHASLSLRPAPGDRGTEVRLTVSYTSPGTVPGGAGARAVASLLGVDPERQARTAVRRLKQILEAGAPPTVVGQPRGARRRSRVESVA